MKRLLLIFVLTGSLLACQEQIIHNQSQQCFKMTISDALPVQFWLNDCETYNEKEVCGVHSFCFCQPFECDDELKVQFIETNPDDYTLGIYDENDTLIHSVDFNNGNLLADYPLSGWTNIAGPDPDWTTGSTPSVTLPTSGGSDKLSETISGIPSGEIKVRYRVELDQFSSVDFTVGFYRLGALLSDIDMAIVAGFNTGEMDFTLAQVPDEIRLSATNLSAGSRTITVHSIRAYLNDSEGVYYDASFIPSNLSPEICNQKIQLKILDGEDNILAKTDCIDIKQNHDCSQLIEYTNNRNLASLNFNQDSSPPITFYLRVPAVFFHKSFPQEQDVIELSNSEFVATSSRLETKKLMQLDYLPYYMHKKIQLALMCQGVTIDNQAWIKRDPYEIVEGSKRYPNKMANVYLTEADNVQRNVL